MVRIVATLLLCVISFPLIGPEVFAGSSDNPLPACCRKGGKHHCAMDRAEQAHGRSTDPAVRSVQMKCPVFPQASVVPVIGAAAIPQPAVLFFAAVVSHPAIHAQTEARYRISFSRAWQKRGPPSFLA